MKPEVGKITSAQYKGQVPQKAKRSVVSTEYTPWSRSSERRFNWIRHHRVMLHPLRDETHIANTSLLRRLLWPEVTPSGVSTWQRLVSRWIRQHNSTRRTAWLPTSSSTPTRRKQPETPYGEISTSKGNKVTRSQGGPLGKSSVPTPFGVKRTSKRIILKRVRKLILHSLLLKLGIKHKTLWRQ